MSNKTVVFIDGANLYATSKALDVEIDFKKLLDSFESKGDFLRAYYYTAVADSQETSVRPLVDWLDYNGFTVVTKPAKEFTDSNGRRRIKGNMDIDLTVDALEMAPYFDEMVLFSGNGEFVPLVMALQRRGKRVTVVSTIKSDSPMIADELRRQADHFVDLDSISVDIAR